MRAHKASIAIALLALNAGCADVSKQDEGNLVIRCPGASGAIAVTDGHVTIDGLVMRVTAELNGPEDVDRGGTFVIDVQVPASGAASPVVECVRMRKPTENSRWDAVPERTAEIRAGPTTRIRAAGGEGPHWRLDESIEVTVWLKTAASGRHVLSLGSQPVRRPE